MYLNEYNKVKRSTVTAGMMWMWPILLRFIQFWTKYFGGNLTNGMKAFN